MFLRESKVKNEGWPSQNQELKYTEFLWQDLCINHIKIWWDILTWRKCANLRQDCLEKLLSVLCAKADGIGTFRKHVHQYCVSQHHDKNIHILVLNCHYYITKITKVNAVQYRSPQGANFAIVLWLLASAALISKHALSSHHMCCRLSQCYVLSYFFACLLYLHRQVVKAYRRMYPVIFMFYMSLNWSTCIQSPLHLQVMFSFWSVWPFLLHPKRVLHS